MSNETIRKKWDDLLDSLKELLKVTELDIDCYSVKFFREEKQLMRYYEKNFEKNKINFNKVKEETNLDLDFKKLEEDSLNLAYEYSDKASKYHEMVKSFIFKIKNINHSVVCKSLFKEDWESFYDLLDIVKVVDLIGFENPILNKVMFKELYSILDRITIEFCEKKSRPILKDFTLEKFHNDPYLDLFFNRFIKTKSNKNKIIIFKNYLESNQEVTWEIKNNDVLSKFNNNSLWKYIINVRNNLEHSIPTFLYINNEEKHQQIIHFMHILVGLNLYLLAEFDNGL